MKKTICVFPFLFFAFSGFGQVVDTAAVVREVDSLTSVAWNLTNKNSLDEAISVGQTALDLSLKALGNQHIWYGTSAFTLGRAYHASGKYERAETLYEEALAIREKIHGQMHMDYCMVLTKIATLYSETGRHKEAEPRLIQALNIPEKVYGKEHRDYVVGLINLGNHYNLISRHEEAEKLFLEALGIQKKITGKDSREYAAALNNLSMTYKAIGEYEKAETCYWEAIEIRKRALGTQNTAYAGNLANLANLLIDLGRYTEAIDLLYEVIDVLEKTNNKKSVRYASALTNLGIAHMDAGNFELSEKFLLEGKTLKESITGNQTPDYAVSLSNLGQLYLETGNYEAARQLLTETITIREKTLGKGHHLVAAAKCRLGQVFYKEQQWKKAEDAFLESKDTYERNFGKEHPEVASVTNRLARLYFATKRYSEAQACYNEVASMTRRLHARAIRHSSIREFDAYKQLYLHRADEYFSFIYTASGQVNHASGTYFENALFFKGLDLELSVKQRRLADKDTVVQKKVELLLACYRQMEKEYVKPLTEQKNITELEAESNALEKELARVLDGFGNAFRQVSWQEVQSSLQSYEAALEFIHFNYTNPDPTDSVLYAALLLKPGMQHPLFIPLCEEKQLKALLPAGDGKINIDQVNELYGIHAADGQNALYRLLWAPLEPHLTGVRTVYYSPSGLLHRLNVSALPTTPQTTLSDRHDLIALGSTRRLVAEGQDNRKSGAATALIYGGIQFNMDSTAYPVRASSNTGGHRGLSFAQTDSTLRGGTWEYLEWSATEADNVRKALTQAGMNAQAIKGWQATEESFKQLGHSAPSPRILHVSTHGYFFPDPANLKSAIRTPPSDEPVFKRSEHPMIRSGLILAGANHAWKTGRPLGKREDGVLTAYEISQLDLRNTDLVVLSACETGLGHIEGNEGVYGLQRAFKIAGAQTLVMSLWQVPDYQTQELMTVFYQKWLSGKMPVRQALHAAQKEMRDKGYEPYYWAGFVAVE